MSDGQAILAAFYGAEGKYIAPDDLRRLLKLSASAMATELGELEKLGYDIEAHPHLGYRLVAAPDRLTADDIRARLHNDVIGTKILVFEETASTNDVVERLARDGSAEGLTVFAESQSDGRGCHGRHWASPRGKGLWFSILLRPTFAPVAVPRLTVAASVAVTLALRQRYRIDARIKWPNDVTVHGKKLAGIMTEAVVERDEIKYAVLGIGININCRAADFPADVAGIATSVLQETGAAQDRAALAAHLLSTLEDSYHVALEDFLLITNEWAQLCTTLGRRVTVSMPGGEIEGHACALHGDGSLLIRKDNGKLERVTGGQLVSER